MYAFKQDVFKLISKHFSIQCFGLLVLDAFCLYLTFKTILIIGQCLQTRGSLLNGLLLDQIDKHLL